MTEPRSIPARAALGVATDKRLDYWAKLSLGGGDQGNGGITVAIKKNFCAQARATRFETPGLHMGLKSLGLRIFF
jgi:hypothetical protein